MRIAHVSDLHIRNFKYRREYAIAFGRLYNALYRLRPDLIVNTGDTVHSKLAVSPELFDDVADHCIRMAEIAPYWLILGNHDLNLKNLGRTDAISPIVRAIEGRTTHPVRLLPPGPVMSLPETIGLTDGIGQIRFWNYDIRGCDFEVFNPDHINVGLYHGSISGCVTDIGFTMEEGESEVSRFSQMDYVLMGDIHKRQSFRGGTMQYPGSLIQQNYGEELVKGFLLWDIRSKVDFTTEFHPIEAPGRFYTVQVPASLDISDIDIPEGSRIRAIVDGELSPSRRLELETALRERFAPLEIITPDSSGERARDDVPDIDELVGSREKLMRDFLTDRTPDPDAVLNLFRRYESSLDPDNVARGTTWQLRRFAWDNMLNYGEGNVVDLSKLRGLVGIFAPNASGKSSIFDILLQAIFDKISKEVPRNIDLVNDNKDVGSMVVELEAAGQPFRIERSIARIHYGQRKLTETKHWGKTSLEFSSVDESLNGTSRPETERAIREIVGSFEDFALTTMVSQNPIFGLPGGGDVINCRETDRRKILFRFLDLDVYERIAVLAKDDLKELMGKLKGLDRDKLSTDLETLREKRLTLEESVTTDRELLSRLEAQLRETTEALQRTDINTLLAALGRRSVIDSDMRTLEGRRSAALRQIDLCEQITRQLAAQLTESKPEIPPIGLSALLIRINELRCEREERLVGKSRGHMRLNQGLKSLVTLEGIPCEGRYPTCHFISEALRFRDERAEIEAAIESLTSEGAEIEQRLTVLEDYEVIHREVLAWEQRHSKLLLKSSENDAELLHCAGNVTDCDAKLCELIRERDLLDRTIQESSSAEVSALRVRHEQNELTVSERRAQVDRTIREMGAIDVRIESLTRDIETLNGLKSRVRSHELVLEMCGKNGIPYQILSLVLPVINAEIAKVLAGVVRFNVFFEDDPDEQTVGIFIRYGDYKSRPLSLGSGAEKFIALLAVRGALLSVSSLPKTDLLIIDEGFGKLDPEHLEALQRMFEYLKEAFGTVFVVSHVDFMRDIVDHSVEITSRDGYAHVEVT